MYRCDPKDKHTGPITGIKCDAYNQVVVTIAMDGKIKFWDFLNLQVNNTIEVCSGPGATLSHLDINSVNNMSVVANESGNDLEPSSISLYVYDIKTLKNIRKFKNISGNKITSTCFSHDSKWIVTASMDKSVKVWDLLTARLVDWVSFTNVPMAVAFSPVGEYLVTSHVGQKGKRFGRDLLIFIL